MHTCQAEQVLSHVCLFFHLWLLFTRCLKSASKERLHVAGIFCLPKGKTKSQVVSKRQLSEMAASAQLSSPIYCSVSVLKRTGRWPAAEPTLNKTMGCYWTGQLGPSRVWVLGEIGLAFHFPSTETEGRESGNVLDVCWVFLFLSSGTELRQALAGMSQGCPPPQYFAGNLHVYLGWPLA